MRNPLLWLLLVVAALALAAQSVQLGGDGTTIVVMGDATVAVTATNFFPLSVSTPAFVKLPRLSLAQLVTNHVTVVRFDDGARLITNSTDTNAGWWLYFDNGVTNGFVPLTNGVIKP